MNKIKILRLELVIILFLLPIQIKVIADCGLPAIPVNTIINEINSKYKEGFICEYKCEFKELFLIEGKTRTCLNGRWIGKIPRCGNLFS
jgi:hypothetical protein